MFRDFKMVVKIGGGFLIVILLTLTIALFSVINFGNVKQALLSGGMVDSIRGELHETLDASDRYFQDGVEADAQAVRTGLSSLATRVATLEGTERNPEMKSQLAALSAALDESGKPLEEYISARTELDRLFSGSVASLNTIESALVEFRTLTLRNRRPDDIQTLTQVRLADSLIALRFRMQTAATSHYYAGSETVSAEGTDTASLFLSLFDAFRSQYRAGTAADALDGIEQDLAAWQVAFGAFDAEQNRLETSRIAFTALLLDAEKGLSGACDSILARTQASLETSVFMVALLGAVAGIIALLLTILLARNISTPVRQLVKDTEALAAGDLAVEIGSGILARRDEVGSLAHAVVHMIERLGKFIGEMGEVSAGVTQGSAHLSETSATIASGAAEQAASVEQVSSSMEEMSSNIRQSADNALQTERIARMSSQAAADGGKAVQETLEAMREIASKIGIIEEIARSTNMLSLNASIEAARAGEYGKGFAVVAAEVGKLAERSQKEAGEISALSLSSVEIAENAGKTIAELVPDIKRTADLVQEISAALNEQKSGIEQINGAIIQLDHVVQQNASSSAQSSEMSSSLAGQAARMQDLIGYFTAGPARSLESSESRKPSLTGKPPVEPNGLALSRQPTPVRSKKFAPPALSRSAPLAAKPSEPTKKTAMLQPKSANMPAKPASLEPKRAFAAVTPALSPVKPVNAPGKPVPALVKPANGSAKQTPAQARQETATAKPAGTAGSAATPLKKTDIAETRPATVTRNRATAANTSAPLAKAGSNAGGDAPGAKANRALPAKPAAPVSPTAPVTPVKPAIGGGAEPEKPMQSTRPTPSERKPPVSIRGKQDDASASHKQRLPLTGIHLVLDDDVAPRGKDDLDGDFKEF